MFNNFLNRNKPTPLFILTFLIAFFYFIPSIAYAATPTTTLETSPTTANGLNGWFKVTPSITLSSSEPGTTYYSWDSTTTWTSGTNPPAQAGVHTLYYYSQDTAFNTEAVKSQVVKVDTSPWQQVSPSGFGDPNNSVLGLNWQGSYKGQQWASSNNGSIWKTADGTNWTTTTVGGLAGNPNNRGLGAAGNYFGYLYGAAGNSVDPVALWRSTDGSNWSSMPLGLAPLPDPSAGGAWVGMLFKGNVYGGTWGIQGGGRIIRSSDGLNWVFANDPGFGDVTKPDSVPKDIWKGNLYGHNGGSPGNSKLYRTASGLANQADWSEVIINNDSANSWYVNSVTGFKGYLYVGKGDGWIWRTQDPGNPSGWTTATAKGFGNPNNGIAGGGFRKINGYLYAQTNNSATGSEVWRTANGTNWENVTPAWSVNNNMSRQMTPYKGKLYLATGNNVVGGEIWAMPFNNTATGNNISPNLGAAATLTFSQVTSAGSTAAWTENWIAPATPPAGHSFLETYYDFSTDVSHTGQITLTIPYDQSEVTGSESNLKIMHWNETSQLWETISTTVDTANNTVTGTTSSLSIFVVAEVPDLIPPTTTLETSPTTTDGLNGWFKTTPTISLSSNEPGTTYYSWDSTTTWTAGTNPPAQLGVHTLYYYSQDTASNTEAVKTQVVKVDTSPWQQVAPSGFGDPNNNSLSLNWQGSYKGQQWASSRNFASGGQIWKTADGTNWTTMTVGGFGGNPNNTGVGAGGNYFGYLYGAANNGIDPVALWRSTDGSNWSSMPLGLTPVPEGGGGAWVGILFKGSVFGGTWGIQGGGPILRSSDGLNWATASDPGFGNANSWGGESPFDFWKGYLYAGNSKLYRTASGLANQADWSEVIINGDPANTNGVSAATSFKGYFYVGKGDGWIWRTQDPGNPSGWTTATAQGFGNPNNGISGNGGFRKINGYLYSLTRNVITGSEIWRTADGTNWVNVTPAWSAKNILTRQMTPFKGKAYLTANNNVDGAEIWAMPFNNTSIGNNVSPDLGGAATLTFSQVTSAGSTAAWTENWMGPAAPPAGHSFLETYYDFSTDVSHTGPITLTIPYDQTEVTGSESNLKIMHWNETTQNWDVVSTTVNTVSNTVTGTTSSLSVFVVAEAQNTKITFDSNRDGNQEIYVMYADGSGQTRLTTNSAWDEVPAFSPNGTKIAFASGRDGNGEIYLMNADGSSQVNLTNSAAEDYRPSFSPDGQKILFQSRSGSGPDGEQIWVMNIDGSNPVKLTNSAGFAARSGFSPDGSKIVFYSNRDGNAEIYVMNADGSNQTRITNNPANDAAPSFSRDGSKILFDTNRDGNMEIYEMNLDGSSPTNLSNNGASDHRPMESLDGAKIAFMSDRNGNQEIYVMNADGSSQINLTNNTANDNAPDWGPVVSSDATPPTTPILAGFTPSTTAINLYWAGATDNIGVTGYKVYDTSDTVVATIAATSHSISGLTPGETKGYYVKAYDAAGNYSTPSNLIVITLSAGGATSAGTGEASETVSPTPTVSLTFSDVTGAGITSVTETTTVPGAEPPGFSFQPGMVYEVTTTASFVPPIFISFNYNEADLTVPESSLKLFHYEGGAWVDVTYSLDTENNVITGKVNSLSPFGIGGSGGPSTGVNTVPLIIFGFLSLSVGAALIKSRRLSILHRKYEY